MDNLLIAACQVIQFSKVRNGCTVVMSETQVARVVWVNFEITIDILSYQSRIWKSQSEIQEKYKVHARNLEVTANDLYLKSEDKIRSSMEIVCYKGRGECSIGFH